MARAPVARETRGDDEATGTGGLSAWRSVARRAAAVVVVAETAGDASRARERAAALAGLADANAWIETCAA